MNSAAALSEQLHPSSFDVARLRSEAKRLRSNDIFLSSAILGLLAGLDKDEAEARKNFSIALQLMPNDYGLRMNYATTLYCINDYAEAREQALRALELIPSHARGLEKALHFCAITGRFGQAEEILGKFSGLRDSEIDRDDHEVALRGTAYLHEHEITEHDVAMLLEAAVSVLRANNAYADNLYIRFMADGESEWMSLHFHLPLPVERVVDLNEQLALGLARMSPRLKADLCVTTLYMTSLVE